MGNLEQAKLSLATIAVCAVALSGGVWWAATSYSGLQNSITIAAIKQDNTTEQLKTLVTGQQETNARLQALASQVQGHEEALHDIDRKLGK